MKQRLFVTLAAVLSAMSPALADYNYGRANVSGTGTDSGNCSRRRPCRTFAYAINQVPAGGAVLALDPADYGPVTITKAITISAPEDATAIISGTGNTGGITVNAGASDVVNLRGLDFENLQAGLVINSGNVNLERSTITGGTFGITVASAGRTSISDTVITGPTDTGINVSSTGSAALILDRVKLIGGGNTAIRSLTSLTMSDSLILGWSNGLVSSGPAFLKRSVIEGSQSGVAVLSGTMFLDTTTITGCTTGITGSFTSYGNNNIVSNGTNIGGPKTTIQPQIVRSGARKSAR